MKMINKMDKC